MSILEVPIFASEDSEVTILEIAYGDDAGYDLFSAETITILPQLCEGVNCKFSTAIPRGYFGKIESRSSMVKHNLITAEGGVMDSGYRGEWFVILFNHSNKPYTVKPGDKIAQVVFLKKETVKFVKVDTLDEILNSERNINSFGSSGSKKRKIEFTESQPLPEEDSCGTESDSDVEIVKEEAKISENNSLILIEKFVKK